MNNSRPRRITRPPARYGMAAPGDVIADAQSVVEPDKSQEIINNSYSDPQSYEEAMSRPDSPHWKLAIELELLAMKRHGVWSLQKLPVGQTLIGCKWVFKKKICGRYKARLVAQGFAQREGVDYDKTFAPVLFYKTLRTICILVANYDLEFKQFDVPTAFLNAECKENVYIYEITQRNYIRKWRT
jgi:hypothetical protein